MTNVELRSVCNLKDGELLQETMNVARREQQTEAELCAYLAVVEERKLYLAEGFSSMHAYCTTELHFSEGAAYQRIRAARLAREFPMILDLLSEGQVHVSGLSVVSSQLTPENHVGLLDACRHKTKREIEALVAELAPKPAVADRIRRLRPAGAARTPAPTELSVPPKETQSGQEVAALAKKPRGTLAPLGASRHAVQFTADDELKALIEEARDLLGHSVRDGELAEVMRRALKSLIKEKRKQKYAECSAPRKAWSREDSRHIPAEIRREVAGRDGYRCTYTAPSGRRCEATSRLEFEHLVPWARNPVHRAENITTRCRAHNLYAADQEFGAEFMRKAKGTLAGESSP